MTELMIPKYILFFVGIVIYAFKIWYSYCRGMSEYILLNTTEFSSIRSTMSQNFRQEINELIAEFKKKNIFAFVIKIFDVIDSLIIYGMYESIPINYLKYP